MAIVEAKTKISGRIILNGGVDSSGTLKTINVSLGTLNPATYDPQKLFNIWAASQTLFNYAPYRCGTSMTTMISEE